MLMKIRVTHTLQRTIDLDVEAEDESTAIAMGLLIASDIQPADWEYTWEPTNEVGVALTI